MGDVIVTVTVDKITAYLSQVQALGYRVESTSDTTYKITAPDGQGSYVVEVIEGGT